MKQGNMNKRTHLVIYVIGDTELSVDGRFEGLVPTQLDKDALKTLNETLYRFNKFQFDAVRISPAYPSIESWNAIKNVVKCDDVAYVDELIDRSFGIIEGKRKLDIRNKLGPKSYKAWDRDPNECPASGESLFDVMDRVRAWYETESFKGGDTILIITHPDVAKAIIMYARPDTTDRMITMDMRRDMIWTVYFEGEQT